MRAKVAAALVGVVFGVALSWTGMTSPEVIRSALLFDDAYLYLMFASAVATALAGQWLLRRVNARALIGGERVCWTPEAPARRHVRGAVIFGAGWGLANACPGPILTQIGQGIWWSVPILAGMAGGVWLFERRQLPDTGRGGGGVYADSGAPVRSSLSVRNEPAGISAVSSRPT
jgi:uncharacterized membrane protein YedE/YeeE